MVSAILAYALLVNALAYGAFAWDKRCATIGARRVSERTLLTLAAIGGSVGAVTAQQRLRHKTYKQPFKGYLYAIVALQVALLATWLALGLRL